MSTSYRYPASWLNSKEHPQQQSLRAAVPETTRSEATLTGLTTTRNQGNPRTSVRGGHQGHGGSVHIAVSPDGFGVAVRRQFRADDYASAHAYATELARERHDTDSPQDFTNRLDVVLPDEVRLVVPTPDPHAAELRYDYKAAVRRLNESVQNSADNEEIAFLKVLSARQVILDAGFPINAPAPASAYRA